MVRNPGPTNRIVPAIIVGGLGWWAYDQSAPAISNGEFSTIPTLAAGIVLVAGCAGISDLARALGGALEIGAAHRSKGVHGTAGFIKNRLQVWRDHKWFGWHPIWGTLKGKVLAFTYESVALTIGPPGSKKSTAVVSPLIMCLRESGIYPDFKGTLVATLARPLRKRGQNVVIIDLGNVFASGGDGLAFYNPLCNLVDLLHKSGGLLIISDEAADLTLLFLPEKDTGGQDNLYFRISSRDYLELVLHINICVLGYAATLGHCLDMLSDQKSLLKHALWFAGRLPVEDAAGHGGEADFPIETAPWAEHHSEEELQDYKAYLKGLAGAIADHLLDPDPRGSGTFLTGARQGLRRFNVTTHASKIMSQTTFRFSELKEEGRITSVFITAEPSRINAQKEALGLLLSCGLKELQRSPNKHVPVTFLADEATNFFISALREDGFLSWARGYGIKVHIIMQFISEYRRVYGDDALKTLLNAAEILQFLPGQSEPEVLQLIEDLLGTRSVVSQNQNSSGAMDGVSSKGYSEVGVSLMTKDQIRRCKKTILFVRQLRPMLVDLPQIFAIEPFRRQVDPDPHHGGKRYLQRVQLRLQGRGGPLLWRLIKALVQPFNTKRRS